MNMSVVKWKIEYVCKDAATDRRIEVVDYLVSDTPPTVESEQKFINQNRERGRYTIEREHFRAMRIDRIPS